MLHAHRTNCFKITYVEIKKIKKLVKNKKY